MMNAFVRNVFLCLCVLATVDPLSSSDGWTSANRTTTFDTGWPPNAARHLSTTTVINRQLPTPSADNQATQSTRTHTSSSSSSHRGSTLHPSNRADERESRQRKERINYRKLNQNKQMKQRYRERNRGQVMQKVNELPDDVDDSWPTTTTTAASYTPMRERYLSPSVTPASTSELISHRTGAIYNRKRFEAAVAGSKDMGSDTNNRNHNSSKSIVNVDSLVLPPMLLLLGENRANGSQLNDYINSTNSNYTADTGDTISWNLNKYPINNNTMEAEASANTSIEHEHHLHQKTANTTTTSSNRDTTGESGRQNSTTPVQDDLNLATLAETAAAAAAAVPTRARISPAASVDQTLGIESSNLSVVVNRTPEGEKTGVNLASKQSSFPAKANNGSFCANFTQSSPPSPAAIGMKVNRSSTLATDNKLREQIFTRTDLNCGLSSTAAASVLNGGNQSDIPPSYSSLPPKSTVLYANSVNSTSSQGSVNVSPITSTTTSNDRQKLTEYSSSDDEGDLADRLAQINSPKHRESIEKTKATSVMFATSLPSSLDVSPTLEASNTDNLSSLLGQEDFGSVHFCTPDRDQHNITWALTDCGVLAFQPCPTPYSGTVYRPCFARGTWGNTDLVMCRVKQLKLLHQLVYQHVQKHLIGGLFSLTIQLKQLLSSTSLHSPLDRLDALNIVNTVLLHSRIKIRVDRFDEEEERRTIDFVQAVVLISDHLITRTKDLVFATDTVKNSLLLGNLVESLHGIRSLMENLLRALILACQDGSIKELPPELLPTVANFDISLSYRKSNNEDFVSLLPGTPLGHSLTVHFNDSSNVGVGVVRVWLTSLSPQFDTNNSRVISDLLLVSIVPAVSIEVNFEVVPKFEVHFHLNADQSGKWPLNSSSNEDADEEEEEEGEEEFAEVMERISCARLDIQSNRPVWRRGGCQTVSLTWTHLYCVCNELGIIAAVVATTATTTTATAVGGIAVPVASMASPSLPPPLARVPPPLPATADVGGIPNGRQQMDHFESQSTSLLDSHPFSNNGHRVNVLFATMTTTRSHSLLYDISLYLSLIASIIFFLITLCVQYRLRRYETRETFFIIRNLVIALLLIELIFLFGTTFHMDLFWIRVAQWSPSSVESPLFHRVKHILCLSVPIFLHFIHLASLFWMLSHSILLYQRFWRMTSEAAANNSQPVESQPKNEKLIQTDFRSCVEQLSTSGQEYRKRYLKRSRNKSVSGKANKRSRLSRATGSLVKVKACRLAHSLFVCPIKMLFQNPIRRNNLEKKRNFPESDSKKSDCNMPMSSILRPEVKMSANECKQPEPTLKQTCRHPSSLKCLLRSGGSFFRTWKCPHYLCLSLGMPFVLVLLSYLLNPKGYETKRYCWMSIEGGIQYSFIFPVLLLITTNTFLMLLVLKRYFEHKPLSPRSQIDQIKPSLRACIMLLPFFSFNWFLSVLSLETLTTSPFELIFALTNCLYSFLVFYFHCYQRYNVQHYLRVRCRQLRLRDKLNRLVQPIVRLFGRSSFVSSSTSFVWSDTDFLSKDLHACSSPVGTTGSNRAECHSIPQQQQQQQDFYAYQPQLNGCYLNCKRHDPMGPVAYCYCSHCQWEGPPDPYATNRSNICKGKVSQPYYDNSASAATDCCSVDTLSKLYQKSATANNCYEQAYSKLSNNEVENLNNKTDESSLYYRDYQSDAYLSEQRERGQHIDDGTSSNMFASTAAACIDRGHYLANKDHHLCGAKQKKALPPPPPQTQPESDDKHEHHHHHHHHHQHYPIGKLNTTFMIGDEDEEVMIVELDDDDDDDDCDEGSDEDVDDEEDVDDDCCDDDDLDDVTLNLSNYLR